MLRDVERYRKMSRDLFFFLCFLALPFACFFLFLISLQISVWLSLLSLSVLPPPFVKLGTSHHPPFYSAGSLYPSPPLWSDPGLAAVPPANPIIPKASHWSKVEVPLTGRPGLQNCLAAACPGPLHKTRPISAATTKPLLGLVHVRGPWCSLRNCLATLNLSQQWRPVFCSIVHSSSCPPTKGFRLQRPHLQRA